MKWSEVIAEKNLQDLPYKIELIVHRVQLTEI